MAQTEKNKMRDGQTWKLTDSTSRKRARYAPLMVKALVTLSQKDFKTACFKVIVYVKGGLGRNTFFCQGGIVTPKRVCY